MSNVGREMVVITEAVLFARLGSEVVVEAVAMLVPDPTEPAVALMVMVALVAFVSVPILQVTN